MDCALEAQDAMTGKAANGCCSDAPDLTRRGGSMWRLAKPVSFVAVLVFVGTIAALSLIPRNWSHTGARSKVSTDGFVSYAAGPGPLAMKPKPGLCQPQIVMNTCLRIKAMDASALTGPVNPSAPAWTVSVDQLMEHFMVSRSSIMDYLRNIGLAEAEVSGVRCKDLCEYMVVNIPPERQPPMSDVGCYYRTQAEIEPICSVDLSMASLEKDVRINRDPNSGPSALGEKFHADWSDAQQDLIDLWDEDKATMSTTDLQKLFNHLHPDVSYGELELLFTRMFRIYPASREMTAGEQFADYARRLEFDTSTYEYADVYDDSCQTSNDGFCDEERYCARGTDCTDCDTCVEGHTKTGLDDSCALANNGHCDPEPDCAQGTDCSDCNECLRGHDTDPAHWSTMALQTGVKASAIASVALTALTAGLGDKVLKTYIGSNADDIKVMVKHILSGVMRTLDFVDFEYPGDECESGTYAYVKAGEPLDKNVEGQYLVYLCELYVKSNPRVQLAALMHQATRMGDVLTHVAKIDGESVYGEDMVRGLAAKCAAGPFSWCMKSVRNADSLYYTIVELGRIRI